MLGFVAFNIILAVAIAFPMYEWKRLRGYTVIADFLDQTTMDSYEHCLYHCVAQGEECAATKFLYDASINNCLTYTMLRNVILKPVSCQYSLYDRRDIYPAPTDLDELNQMIFAGTYMGDACPRGTIDNIHNCALATTEEKCREYADFFEPIYNGTHCIMKLAQPRQDYYCVAKGVKSTSYFTATSKTCYFNIIVPANETIKYYDDQCKAVSSISQLPTICDNQTNLFLQDFNENKPRLLGLYAPAGTQTLQWYDGSTCTFRDWPTPQYSPHYNTNDAETYVINTKFWMSAWMVNYEMTPTLTLTCQEPAYTLAEYWTNCENLDGCIQINKKLPPFEYDFHDEL